MTTREGWEDAQEERSTMSTKGKKTQGFTMKGEVGKQYQMVQSIRTEKCLLDWRK